MKFSQEELKKIFDRAALDHDGLIRIEEIIIVIRSMEQAQFDKLAGALQLGGDTNHDRQLSFEEFVEFCQR